MKPLIFVIFIAIAGHAAQAACPDQSLMRNAARGWIAGQRLPDPVVATMADARCAYAPFRDVLAAELGPPVGVKVGFTSAAVQSRYGISEPIAGALFAPMLVGDGSRLSLRGARSPLYEADLVVTVGDAAIMRARTRAEAAAALRDVRPFIELPDIALRQGVVPTAPLMAAYGVTPWRGVLGQGVALADLADPVGDLARMTVALKVDGRTVTTAQGSALLGHPLDVVLWLVQRGGQDLTPGMIISLGSFGTLGPALPGQRIEAEYDIAGHPMRASVTLVP
ncbi:hydratase [Paracoccus yeei]|uniref:Hydratase n=3 Tax=Paracoccaceae TaxID=31989 RepID=A0A1V0GQY7_9RHOB|nr:fumarylacetoacetate hydrolase family protein [Paracoccus yeei]ARC36277.2 hydratase [Paracoccus yeei]AWX92846.1 hydratase [Paracoccus mutanolyticus]